MFRGLVAAAFLAAALACVAYDFALQRRIEALQTDLAARRTDLASLRTIDAEVTRYREQKDELQARIDAINTLKQNQKTASSAITKLAGAEGVLAPIESVAVTVAKGLVLNGSGSAESAARLARHFEGASVRRSGDAFTIEVRP